MALMKSMDNLENKIQSYMIEKEKKEEKIKEALIKAKEKRQEKIRLFFSHDKNVKQRIEKNEELAKNRRRKLLDDIERKNLRSFVIRKEKLKIIEEQKLMNKLKKEKAENLKIKLETIMKTEYNIPETKKNEIINNLLTNEK